MLKDSRKCRRMRRIFHVLDRRKVEVEKCQLEERRDPCPAASWRSHPPKFTDPLSEVFNRALSCGLGC